MSEVGKIVQIAMAQSEEACIDELFLDENGKVWQWKYETKITKEIDPKTNDQGMLLEKTLYITKRRLAEISMTTDWQEYSRRNGSSQWIKQDNGDNK